MIKKKYTAIPPFIKTQFILIIGFVLVSCTSIESQAQPIPTFPYPLVGTINHQATSTNTSSPTSLPTKRIIPTFTATRPAPTSTKIPTPIETSPYHYHLPPLVTGAPLGDGLIYEDYEYFTMTACPNKWVYPAEEPCIQVLACGWGDDYDSGAIYVLDTCGGPGGYFVPSPDTGYLRIIGAKGDRVVIESRQGYISIFDISEMEFVDSLIDK